MTRQNSTTNATTLGLLTSTKLASKKEGKRFFEAVRDSAPMLLPDKCGRYEPLRQRFSFDDVMTSLDGWEDFYIWSRKTPESLGVFSSGRAYRVHDTLSFHIECECSEQDELVQLGLNISQMFKADICYIHRHFEQDTKNIETYRKKMMPFAQGLTTFDLREGLPGVCWFTFFGIPYVDLFGRKRLLRAPVYKAEEAGHGVSLQLTERIDDGEKDYEAFEGIRQETINYLNSDAFVGDRRATRIPDFNLG